MNGIVQTTDENTFFKLVLDLIVQTVTFIDYKYHRYHYE